MNPRIKILNDKTNYSGKSVIYIMSTDQRINDNHALFLAQKSALDKKIPLVVYFNLYTTLSVRAYQHFEFMLLNIEKIALNLEKLNILFWIENGDLSKNLGKIINKFNPSEIYFDFSPLKYSRVQQEQIAKKYNFSIFSVDTHNIVPVWLASQKEEWSAYTLRPKINKLLPEFLKENEKIIRHPFKINLKSNFYLASYLKNVKAKKLKNYKLDFKSGEDEALKKLNIFISKKLDQYDNLRSDPTVDYQSSLSPYLHFGQISPVRIVNEIKKSSANSKSKEAFLEELIVRRELASNFCYYNSNYDNFNGLRNWAKETLNKHEVDSRKKIYSLQQLENATTYDSAWNAAQLQLLRTGKIHGYMRMYWAKKILEWTKNASEAIKYAVYLNDKYQLDGLDPNGYVGILWSIGGVHDRPWFERPIFGTIRYMAFNGLTRKFDIKNYINNITKLNNKFK